MCEASNFTRKAIRAANLETRISKFRVQPKASNAPAGQRINEKLPVSEIVQ